MIDIHDVDDDDDGMKVEDDVGIDNICNVICSITVITAHLMSDAFNHQQHCKPEIHSRQIDIGIDVTCNATLDLKKHETNNHHLGGSQ